MNKLRDNGFQIIAACFEDKVPRYTDKNFHLAFRIYPEPSGTVYCREDLIEEKNVEILFDYCSILEVIIYKVGWEFLINTYGYEKLFELNKKSDWLDTEDMDEFIKDIEIVMGYSEYMGS